jgi:hypothetical protein
MKEYNLIFNKTQIARVSILAVRKAVKSGLFKKEKSVVERQKIIRDLNEELSNIYNLPILHIDFVDGWVMTGSYCASKKKIILNKTSLTTFLHEFYHYKADVKGLENTEELARGWSLSLFYLATPKLFENAVSKGLIIHQKEITSPEPREEVSGEESS